jgi:hypothetical protein
MALTAASDRFSDVKWADLGIDSFSLTSIQVEDMEVADMGEPIEWDGFCVRNGENEEGGLGAGEGEGEEGGFTALPGKGDDEDDEGEFDAMP